MVILIRLCASIQLFAVICIMSFYNVLGCGQLPQTEVTATSFTTTGFTLSAGMVYSESSAAHALVPELSRNEQTARAFVKNLVMNAVYDVLQQQGRNAFLSDAVILVILQQLNVEINYMPLNCKTASKDPMNAGDPVAVDGCFVINDIVASVCTAARCMHPNMMVKPVPSDNMSFNGTIKTSNVVMANWSRQMWQSVLSRVLQRLTSGQFAKYFSTAVVMVNS